MASFLQLAAEQGGTRFGPFQGGTIQLGTDQQRCQLVLGPMPGIAPVHAMIVDNGNGTFTVQPAQRGLGLFLQQQASGQMWPLDAAVTARSGDVVVIGSQAGPRFTLQHEGMKPGGRAGAVAAAGGGGVAAAMPGFMGNNPGMRRIQQQGGMGNALAKEVQRQTRAKMLAKLGLGEYYSMWYRYKSGTYFQPRYILAALGSIAVLVGGGLVSCFGLLSAWFLGQ